MPGSDLVVENVSLNETRTALLDVLADMGAAIEVEPDASEPHREPVGTIRVRGSDPSRHDGVAGTTPRHDRRGTYSRRGSDPGGGSTTVDGASELRVKESDRLTAIVGGLGALGADVEERESGFTVRGGQKLRPASLRSYGDHRMVMAWAIASLLVDGDCTIDHLDQVKISYPGFWRTLDRLVQ